MADASVVTAKPKSDLPVRLVSAVLMLAILGAAIWNNDPYLQWLVLVVGALCFAEFVLLAMKATANPSFRIAGIIAGAAYIGLAVWMMLQLPLLFFGAAVGTVVFTDVFAYFAGRSIGGPKIAPAISPSKTWAGLLGGMAGAAIFLVILGTVYYFIGGFGTVSEILSENRVEFLTIASLGAGLAVVAQCGDFFESWLKRKAGVKDSSKLIPGHGGVFDRVDGLLPVSIVIGVLFGYFGG
ncbi:phosphatidate cytidylyltransferase [Erythrobacter sp. SDW2]|uniref:phosphatidate cytidylyltransferase n=1 Tax=Erythrobacter sp. SDW2 TaxID=2907154 RepID=UPI001F3A3F8D|nr:phosphatidate cytidylyltransferase [Erythrobacter sp. SDW2]UIP06116.1 phosphatidate cytidylyltransferase [Erythrobacter sp. SDW2]